MIPTFSVESMKTAAKAHDPARRVWADSLRYGPAAIIPAATAVVAAAVFTRLLTPGQYGLYGLILSFVSPAATVVGQSVGNGTGRYYIEYNRSGQLDTYRQAVTWLVAAGWLCTAAITLTASLLALAMGASRELLWMLIGGGVLVGSLSTGAMIVPILSASFRPTYYSLVNSLAALLSFFVAWAFVWALGRHAYWLIWGSAMGQGLTLPLLFRQFPLSRLRSVRRLAPETKNAVVMFVSYGVPMVLWVLASSLMGLADRSVLQWFEGSASVGIYGINNNMAGQAIGLAIGPFITASWPILMQQWANQGGQTVQATLRSFTKSYTTLCIGIVGVTVVAGKPIESIILGSQFVGGWGLLMPCLVGSAFWGAGRLGHATLKLAGKTRVLALDALICGIFNVVLNIVFVPQFGMYGAAYSLIPSFILYSVLVWVQSRAVLPWTIDFKHIGYCLAAALVAVLASRAIQADFGPSPFVQVAAGAGVFAILYCAGQLVVHFSGDKIPPLRLFRREEHLG